MSSGRSIQAPSSIAARQPATPRSTFCTAPALEPLRPTLAGCLDERVGDGMDEVGVRRQVALPLPKGPFVSPRWLVSEPLRSAPASRRTVEMELGMAEIHAGTATSVDRAVFPLVGSTLAKSRLDRDASPSVVAQAA